MFRQALILVLFLTLVCASVFGQESGALADPMKPYRHANPGRETVPSYSVSGTFISPSTRVAIFNGIPSREGDFVDGAEILSIGTKSIRIRTGSRERTVFVGPNGGRDPSSDPGIQISRRPTPLQPSPELNLASDSVQPQVPSRPRFDRHARHGPVKRGETLSGIAQHYLSDGISLNEMMIALFQANPQAFSGNINVLHEGAILLIPADKELNNRTRTDAVAEVERQRIDWRQRPLQHNGLTNVAGHGAFGPVKRGETLSAIAQHYLSDIITMNQMIIALFQANPQAFSGNINLLHEGAVLRIPNGDELRSQSAEIATAEVLRQTDAWRADSRQQARRNAVPANDSKADPPKPLRNS